MISSIHRFFFDKICAKFSTKKIKHLRTKHQPIGDSVLQSYASDKPEKVGKVVEDDDEKKRNTKTVQRK